MLVIE